MLLVCAAVCITVVFGQPVKTGMVGTALIAPATTAITLNTQPVTLPVIYTLFTDSVDGGCNAVGNCRALPVMLLTFEGKRIDAGNVLLDWKTTNEINNAGFDVERSLGGDDAPFGKIAFVKGKNGGSKENKYQLPDANAFIGTSYYRLKQIDMDGQFVYSNIIAIKNTGEQSLKLFPNPASSTLYVNVVVTTGAKAQLYISDAQGKVIIALQPYLSRGNNQQQVPVNSLAAGTYFVKVATAAGAVMVSSFVKK